MCKAETLWSFIAKKSYIAWIAALLVIIQAILTIIEVIVIERFIDGLSDFQWKRLIFFAIILSGIYAFYYLQNPLLDYLKQKLSLQIRIHLEDSIIEKMARISVAALEDVENQSCIARLKEKPEKRYANGFFSILQIIGGIVGMSGIFSLLFHHVPFFFLVILLLFGLMVIVFRLTGKMKIALYQTRQEIGRRGDYLSSILFERNLAQEKKLFGYTHYIQKLYKEETIQSSKQMLISIGVYHIILWVYDAITYLFSASAYLLFLIPLYKGEMEIGLYIAMIPALTKLGAFFVAVGSKYWPAYQEYRACFADFIQFYALPEQDYIEKKEITFHIIKGENIVFRYPGQEKPILNGLNFIFQVGKNYALVGENGCGKTTFIKLLMGFYQPESGTITIDNKDIKELTFAERQSLFSAVFQDFNHYTYTIKENIFLSNLKEKTAITEKMQQAAKEAELDSWISSYPYAYNTQLGTLEENGIELSGGQWQRLSIARMLYRKANIYIWDEPTAAMDPLAESRLYTNFLQKRSKQCANIFVTHRLGAAVCADEIYVLENGKLVEQGSHIQLMQKSDGLYRQMFQAQKGMYE